MGVDTYVLGMAKKKEQIALRLPAEQMEAVRRFAEWRHAAGVDDQVNVTGSISFIIRFFEIMGGFHEPLEAINRVAKAHETPAVPRKK